MKKEANKQGFSLIEVVLSLLVVGIGSLAVFGLFADGLKSAEWNRRDTNCSMFASYVMGTLREQIMTADNPQVILDNSTLDLEPRLNSSGASWMYEMSTAVQAQIGSWSSAAPAVCNLTFVAPSGYAEETALVAAHSMNFRYKLVITAAGNDYYDGKTAMAIYLAVWSHTDSSYKERNAKLYYTEVNCGNMYSTDDQAPLPF